MKDCKPIYLIKNSNTYKGELSYPQHCMAKICNHKDTQKDKYLLAVLEW